jgi:hypothetical protein
MKVGDRVFYRDNGPSDQGTIVGLTKNTTWTYTVKFDGIENGDMLSEPDDYRAEQLELVKE